MDDPYLIMIDEATEGLAPKVVALVAEESLALKEKGVSLLLRSKSWRSRSIFRRESR